VSRDPDVLAFGSRRAELPARRCIEVAHPETAGPVRKEIQHLSAEIERTATVVEAGVDQGALADRRRPLRREVRTDRAVHVCSTEPGGVAVARETHFKP